MGLPESFLSRAKAAGCEAFRSNGNVDVQALARWLADNPVSTEEKQSELGAVQLARLRDKARRDRVAADLAEGKVIDRDQCKRAVTRYVTAVRNRVLGLAKRNAQRLAIETDPIAVEQHLEAETRAILTDLKFEFGLLACPNCGKEVNL